MTEANRFNIPLFLQQHSHKNIQELANDGCYPPERDFVFMDRNRPPTSTLNLLILGGLVALFSLFTAQLPLFAESHAADIDVKAIVKRMDELYRSDTSQTNMEMQIVTPHWERTLSLRVWTEGMDKTFIRIDAPKKEKGVTTLRIGNEMWNYLPKTNKVIKVPPSMMMGSWMGSDFTNDDLVKESSMLNDYSYDLIVPDDAKPVIFTSGSFRRKILQLFGARSSRLVGQMI